MANYVGIDVGSEYLHAAVLDSDKELILTPKSRIHYGNPSVSLTKAFDEIRSAGIDVDDCVVGFTGSGGEDFSKYLNKSCFYDSVTVPIGAHYFNEDSKYVFHIGSRDPYFFDIDNIGENGNERVVVFDNCAGTKCGGGSGVLIGKTVRRLFSEMVEGDSLDGQMDEMYELAYETAKSSEKSIDVGGRCGIVMQSDMIHLQNRGESIGDILGGMFNRVASNYKNSVVRMRQLDRNYGAVATGGVFLNPIISDSLSEEIGVKIYTPENPQIVGAVGAALKLMENGHEKGIDLDKIEQVIEGEKRKVRFAPPLSSALDDVKIIEEDLDSEKYGNVVYYPNSFVGNGKEKVVMGVDGGSTTTKVVLVRRGGLETLAESIVSTNGRPVEAIQGILKEMGEVVEGKVDILGTCYTGSSGAFYHRLFTLLGNEKSADIVTDEITCHGLGVKHYNEKVDTICELGGQDAKFTCFNKDGTVKKSKMNLSCMAGTGQTMENMIKMIGLDYESFEELALRAERTPVVDDTCGIFTEAGISRLVSFEFPIEEIAAAIAYGFIGGYSKKFVGNEKFGDCISAQGGPFNNKANLAALALHIGKEVNAFPHRQLFGAYGAAIAVDNFLNENGGDNGK
ncbi:hypothetical protein CMI46_03185 [Candidatus Pacearchaeota archaeon]|nr:hypothetical protein [Candidatus Pacearchaeota archaeon]|tara:strand:+ start:2474 stop:4342 length:1869 start_codon:yes stop_codon:yes gene_type:complete